MILFKRRLLAAAAVISVTIPYIAHACHELTARDKMFWNQISSKPKIFLYPHEPASLAPAESGLAALNEKGVEAYRRGIYPEAENFFLKALGSGSKAPEVYHNLAMVNYTRLKLDKAAEYWKIAVAMEPENARYHYHLAGALSHDGKVDEAIAEYTAALKSSPSRHEIHNQLGQLYEFKGDIEKATAYFQIAVEEKPDYIKALQNLGAAYKKRNKVADAEKVYLKMLEIDSRDVETFIKLGVINAGKGELGQAEKYLKSAVSIRPDYPYPRFLLAEVYADMGKTRKAEKLIKLAQTVRLDNYIGCIIDPTPDTSVPKRKHTLGRGSAVQIP